MASSFTDIKVIRSPALTEVKSSEWIDIIQFDRLALATEAHGRPLTKIDASNQQWVLSPMGESFILVGMDMRQSMTAETWCAEIIV